jgi:hypothetical protein
MSEAELAKQFTETMPSFKYAKEYREKLGLTGDASKLNADKCLGVAALVGIILAEQAASGKSLEDGLEIVTHFVEVCAKMHHITLKGTVTPKQTRPPTVEHLEQLPLDTGVNGDVVIQIDEAGLRTGLMWMSIGGEWVSSEDFAINPRIAKLVEKATK